LQPQQDAAAQGQDSGHSALASAAEEVPAARLESAVHKAQALPQQGISLQGMTAVQPQALEGLRICCVRPARPSRMKLRHRARRRQCRAEPTCRPQPLPSGQPWGSERRHAGRRSEQLRLRPEPGGQDAAPTEREQEVSEQVAFWVHQKTQNAALSIQHEGKAIQVQVQLNGQEAHVRFAAGDEQARQLLADGQAQLRELCRPRG
jgi:flagellar hook-length control protein FliK